MDSKPVPTPSPAQVHKEASLSCSSGSCSFPIRAPPTVDSDVEFSFSTNNYNSSYSSGDSDYSVSGFESEGFASGEDEFESASERPFVADPDNETLEETIVVDENAVSRPNVRDPFGEIREMGGLVRVTSRPSVEEDSDEESLGSTMEEEGECNNVVEPAIVDVGVSEGQKLGVPIAKLTRDSDDDDSVVSEEVEDDGFLGAARVSSFWVLEKAIDVVRLQAFGAEEGEGGESDFKPELVVLAEDSKVLGLSEEGIPMKDSCVDSFPAERAENLGADSMEESKESFVEDIDDDLEVDSNTKYLVEEDRDIKQQEHQVNEIIVTEMDETGHSIELRYLDMERDVGSEAGLSCYETKESNFPGLELKVSEQVNDRMVSAVEGVKDTSRDSVHAFEEAKFESFAADISDNSEIDSDPKYWGEKVQDMKQQESQDSDFEKDGEVVRSDKTEHCVECVVLESDREVDSGDGLIVNESRETNLTYPEATISKEVDAKMVSAYKLAEADGRSEDFDVGLDHRNSVINETNELKLVGSDALAIQLVEHSIPSESIKAEGQQIKDDEVSHSGEAFEGLTSGLSSVTNQIKDKVTQNLTPCSLGESWQDEWQQSGAAVGDLDEVEMEAESDGGEISSGASLSMTSPNGSIMFSVDSISSVFSSRAALALKQPSSFTPPELAAKAADEPEQNLSVEERNRIENMQWIRLKFLRLVNRLGISPDDSIAAQVLYQLVLAAGVPSDETFSLDFAKKAAKQLEEQCMDDLDFSLNILVLGKTGVGKSATINSIFGEERATVDAFQPGTTAVMDITGMITGVKFRIFDTPGLRSSLSEYTVNRKILSSIKKLTRKWPPDVVLYVDRLDTQTRGHDDLPLLKSITNSLGSSIWHNTMVVLTHARSIPPDGPSGSPVNYDLLVAQKSQALQQMIFQAVSDLPMISPSLLSPVSLVENHPSCQKTHDGQMVLPNGESWRPKLLLLCYSMKILSEACSIAKTEHPRAPPLPYFLSSLLQSHSHPKLPADSGHQSLDLDIELENFSDSDLQDEDEYDQLPPFKPLGRTQIAQLSKEQREAYYEEYDYRMKLLQQKQLREELKRLREVKKRGHDAGMNNGYVNEDGGQESEIPAAESVPLPEMELPPSFDGDNPVYRYRFVEPTFKLLSRPVLDTHGWDHDCGYDGFAIEESVAIAGHFPCVVAVQFTKDKNIFNSQMDSPVAVKHGENGSTTAGPRVLTICNHHAYNLKGETNIKNFKANKATAGLMVKILGENVATGIKVEDQIMARKHLVLVGGTGAIRSRGEAAWGANLELRLWEKDYPIGKDQTLMGLSLVRWRGDILWGCNLQSQFSMGRNSKMTIGARLNKSSGQVCVRISSSEQLQIAFLGVLPIVHAIFRRIFLQSSEK